MSEISPSTVLSLNLINLLNLTTVTSSSTTTRSMTIVEMLLVILVLSTIVISCICGNILVILSVFTFRPLRTVQNFFIVSLAFSDMLVAITVMPFHIVQQILNRWIFGEIFCQVFVTCDVLLCTSSILNLCAIALDRYWAISDPIQYARQRTIRRVLFMITLVWVLSAIISIPPIIATVLGFNELRIFNNLQQCQLSDNKIYVVYSACGSFYIPAVIMTAVYAQVFIKTRIRFRERARAAAKLANATRTHKSYTMTSNLNDPLHHNLYQSLNSSIRHPTNVSPKYSPSNCSGLDNFSTDDAEEMLCLKEECPKQVSSSTLNHNNTLNNHFILSPKSDISISQASLSISIDESKILPMIHDTPRASVELSLPLDSQGSVRECKSENGFLSQQQNASVQTTELSTKSKLSPVHRASKETNRKMFFRGKSLASLMHERQKISLTRERRLSRTLGIIISVFLLCWLPFFIFYILTPFIDVSRYIKEPLPTLFLWLGYVNSAVNPLIYTIFNVEFRTAFKRLLFPTMTKKSLKRNYTTKQYKTIKF